MLVVITVVKLFILLHYFLLMSVDDLSALSSAELNQQFISYLLHIQFLFIFV